jgi:hypothetical protein
VLVGQPDRHVGAGTGEAQRTEGMSVQPFGAFVERRIVIVPGRNRIVDVDA